mgnify:CR=1 FL=1
MALRGEVLLVALVLAVLVVLRGAEAQTEGKCIQRDTVHWDAVAEEWQYNSTDPYLKVRTIPGFRWEGGPVWGEIAGN